MEVLREGERLRLGDVLDIEIVTDRDLSMLGEARHKTISGRGVVGRLIDKVTHGG